MPSRILREGIITSEPVNLLSEPAENLYRRLMSVVDDYGRYYGNPTLIRAACYPLRINQTTDKDIESRLGEMQKHGLVVQYGVNGKKYIEISNFNQRQRSDSKFPTPCPTNDGQMTDKCPHNDNQMTPLGGGVVVCVSEGVCESPADKQPAHKNEKGKPEKTELPDWIPLDLWKEWMSIRVKRKAVNSPLALKSLITKLDEIRTSGISVNRAIKMAIENSWKSVELEWVKNKMGDKK